jgi:hypothetical protein
LYRFFSWLVYIQQNPFKVLAVIEERKNLRKKDRVSFEILIFPNGQLDRDDEYTSPWTGFELTTLVVIGTDYTGSCKSKYHTVTTTTAHVHYIGKHAKIKWTRVLLYSTILTDPQVEVIATYSMQHYVIKFVNDTSCDRSVVFSGYSGFLHQ